MSSSRAPLRVDPRNLLDPADPPLAVALDGRWSSASIIALDRSVESPSAQFVEAPAALVRLEDPECGAMVPLRELGSGHADEGLAYTASLVVGQDVDRV